MLCPVGTTGLIIVHFFSTSMVVRAMVRNIRTVRTRKFNPNPFAMQMETEAPAW